MAQGPGGGLADKEVFVAQQGQQPRDIVEACPRIKVLGGAHGGVDIRRFERPHNFDPVLVAHE
jgi:hypothetical protein